LAVEHVNRNTAGYVDFEKVYPPPLPQGVAPVDLELML
jgi:hypothetical protein